MNDGQPSAVQRTLLYVRSARHLRWQQLVYRPIRSLQARRAAPLAPHACADPEKVPRIAAVAAGWGHPDGVQAVRRADMVCEGHFEWLNEGRLLSDVDWNRRQVSPLWSYNLHYFDYARDLAWAYRITGEERYRRCYQRLVGDWIRDTADGRGDGWQPYPLSLRVINWIVSLALMGSSLDDAFRARVVDSLYRQLRFLERRHEWHILGNHLQKNLVAQLVGGLFFTGRDAMRWRRTASAALWSQLEEQILDDGGHFERSPMYHAIACCDLLELVHLMQACTEPVPRHVEVRISALVDALGMLFRPSGEPHLFNDAATGIAPPVSYLDRLATTWRGRGIPFASGAWCLPEAGYHGYVDALAGERLTVDCGPIGPSYQPGHAHCDMLSYELDMAGRPVVVDSGVAGYDGDPLREYVRSTRAHNTVSVGGREQSEMWGTFRVARRAIPQGSQSGVREGVYRFAGAYSPYYDARVRHTREFTGRAGGWTVRDRLDGIGSARVHSYLHLHPDFEATVDGSTVVARSGDCTVLIDAGQALAVRLYRGTDRPHQGWYCPEFGLRIPAFAVEMEMPPGVSGYTIRLPGAGVAPVSDPLDEQ